MTMTLDKETTGEPMDMQTLVMVHDNGKANQVSKHVRASVRTPRSLLCLPSPLGCDGYLF